MNWRVGFLLLVVLSAASVPTAGAGELAPGGTFWDDDGNVHEGNIEAIHAEGITVGCAPALYCPTDPVTRAQMAAFLSRSLDLAAASQDYFDDDEQSVLEDDINRVAQAGITLGCAPTEFCPEDRVTRQQMAAFLVRGYGWSDDGGGNHFTDDDGSSFEHYIDILATAGVTLGCGPGLYCPTEIVRRDQMASFLARAAGLDPIVPPDRFPNGHVVPDDVGVTIGAGVIGQTPTAVVGGQTITIDGTVLENVVIDGCVTIEADDVTIRNVVINCAGFYPIKVNDGSVHDGLSVHHSHINGLIAAKLFLLNDVTNVDISYNELTGGDDTVFADGALDGFIFSHNYRHDPLGDETSHLDGFQIGEFETTTGRLEISYNYFDVIPDNIGVTDLVFATNFAEVHIDVIGNYIAEHGYYTLRAHNLATLTVVDNTIENGVNRVALLTSPGPHHFACNFFDDGTPVTPADIAGDASTVTYGGCQ